MHACKLKRTDRYPHARASHSLLTEFTLEKHLPASAIQHAECAPAGVCEKASCQPPLCLSWLVAQCVLAAGALQMAAARSVVWAATLWRTVPALLVHWALRQWEMPQCLTQIQFVQVTDWPLAGLSGLNPSKPQPTHAVHLDLLSAFLLPPQPCLLQFQIAPQSPLKGSCSICTPQSSWYCRTTSHHT